MRTPPTSKSQVVCDRLSSDFSYLFAQRATRYPRRDTRFQSLKLTLAFRLVNQPFAAEQKRKGHCKAGLWTLDWTVDWTVDWTMD